MSKCPCGSDLAYDSCCQPLIKGEAFAKTAEQLMRSRYSAYVNTEIDYISNTTDPERMADFDAASAKDWAENSEWHGLEIVAAEKGGENDDFGKVEFIVNYTQNGVKNRHHELSDFRKIDDKWFFMDGEAVAPQPVVRDTPKVGRNEPCPCGSGKKFKKCCG